MHSMNISPDQAERLRKVKAAALERLKLQERTSTPTVKTQDKGKMFTHRRTGMDEGLGNTILTNKLGEDTTLERRKRILENQKKAIRVDLNIANLDDFMEYLKTREPIRKKRERYQAKLKDISGFQPDNNRRNSFVSEDAYDVDTADIEVYINGRKSSDFDIHVRKYHHSVELYFDYKHKKKYNRIPLQFKAPSQRPATRKIQLGETSKEEEKEQKKIFGTVVNLDGFYRWMRNGKKTPEENTSDKPSVQYIGRTGRKHRNVFEQYASVNETENSVDIKVEIPDIEEMQQDKVISTQNIIEELVELIRKQIYSNIFGEENIVDKKLRDFTEELVNEERILNFISHEIEESTEFVIDEKEIDCSISYPMQELSQTGNGQKENCGFKPYDAKLLISKDEHTLYIRSAMSKSMMVFEVENGCAFQTAYFLYSFFSSDCRYKRSLPPLQLLKNLGVQKMRKAYSTGIENNYYLYHWIYIRNFTDERQNHFASEMKRLGLE